MWKYCYLNFQSEWSIDLAASMPVFDIDRSNTGHPVDFLSGGRCTDNYCVEAGEVTERRSIVRGLGKQLRCNSAGFGSANFSIVCNRWIFRLLTPGGWKAAFPSRSIVIDCCNRGVVSKMRPWAEGWFVNEVCTVIDVTGSRSLDWRAAQSSVPSWPRCDTDQISCNGARSVVAHSVEIWGSTVVFMDVFLLWIEVPITLIGPRYVTT